MKLDYYENTYPRSDSLLTVLVTASLFSVRPAQAYTVTLQQMGANVVVTGRGPINLTGLTFVGSNQSTAFLVATSATIGTGPMTPTNVDFYGGFTGPISFGPPHQTRSIPTLAAETLSI